MDPRQRRLLDALRCKYQTLLELRVRHAQDASIAPRAELARLAAEFPGALRELDRLPLAKLEARLFALERVLAAGAEPERWMALQCAYHGFMRAALRIRRALRDRPANVVDAVAELVAVAYVPAEDEPPAARFAVADLSALRHPPNGRLNPWVVLQVARDHAVTPEQVRAALFEP